MSNRNRRNQPQVKKGPYNKTNAYSQKPVLEQILAIIAFLVLLVLHSIFIVPPIVAVIKHPILLVMLGVHYVLIIIIGYDYIILTVKDPVDRIVSKQMDENQQQPAKMKRCIICSSNVFLMSYHCMRCNRCTQKFDHHCKYLNNCVGGLNYQSFFRILAILTIYLLNAIGQAIWVFVESFYNQQLQDYQISKWPVLAAGVIIILLIIAVDSLLIFHIYLTVFRKMTTLQYIFRQTPSNQSSAQEVVQSQGRMNSENQQV